MAGRGRGGIRVLAGHRGDQRPGDGFYQNSADVYGVSWLAVRYLVDRIGLGKVATLSKALTTYQPQR